MKSAVVVFPGINREHDMARALKLASGNETAMAWHADTALPQGTDLQAALKQGDRSLLMPDNQAGCFVEEIVTLCADSSAALFVLFSY